MFFFFLLLLYSLLGFVTENMTEGDREMSLPRIVAAGLAGIDIRSRFGSQVSAKDRSLSRPLSRPELCMHTIPFVIVLCFFVLWAVSSGMFNLALRFVAIEGNRTPGITLQVLHPAMLYMLIYESNSPTVECLFDRSINRSSWEPRDF